MSDNASQQISDAALILKHGGVIAYPTEAVFGLGCDPFNKKAVAKLLKIKHRPQAKGLILIGANWQQLEALVKPINPQAMVQIFETWPGPSTWVFPKSSIVPEWIHGDYNSIAIRITDHPVAKQLCQVFNGPIVSTSANYEGFPAIRDLDTLKMTFSKQIDFIVPGSVGPRTNPSEIRDAISGEILRKG